MKAEEFSDIRANVLYILQRKSLPPYLRDEAEGEIFLRALRQYGRVSRETTQAVLWVAVRDLYWDSLSPLTGVSATTKYRDIKQGKLSTRTVSMSASQDVLDFVENRVQKSESSHVSDLAFVRAACDVLSTKEREAVDLLYYEPATEYTFGRPPDNRSQFGLTASEAGRRLGITEAAVRARQKKALNKLRKELDESGSGNRHEEQEVHDLDSRPDHAQAVHACLGVDQGAS